MHCFQAVNCFHVLWRLYNISQDSLKDILQSRPSEWKNGVHATKAFEWTRQQSLLIMNNDWLLATGWYCACHLQHCAKSCNRSQIHLCTTERTTRCWRIALFKKPNGVFRSISDHSFVFNATHNKTRIRTVCWTNKKVSSNFQQYSRCLIVSIDVFPAVLLEFPYSHLWVRQQHQSFSGAKLQPYIDLMLRLRET